MYTINGSKNRKYTKTMEENLTETLGTFLAICFENKYSELILRGIVIFNF